jgi:Flp pilus assembly protein TadB
MKRQEFQRRFEEASRLKDECSRKSDEISLFRLGSFLGFLMAFIVWLIKGYAILWFVSLIFIVGFIILVFIHQKVSRKERYYLLLKKTLQEYLDRFTNDWLFFSDGGMDSVKNEFTFLSDLILSVMPLCSNI